jgi:hypothetical protein
MSLSVEGCSKCWGTDASEAWDRHHALDSVADIVEESHFSVRVIACADCGQRFASVFCERIDWQGGNDPQDWLLVPITVEESEAMIAAGENGVEGVLRRLEGERRFLLRYFADEIHVGFRDGTIIVPPHD